MGKTNQTPKKISKECWIRRVIKTGLERICEGLKKMNTILYCSDVQGDFEALKLFRDIAEKRKPDAVIVSGDLIDGVFPEEEKGAYVKTAQVLNFLKGRFKDLVLGYLRTDENMIKSVVPPELFHKITE